MHAPSIEELIAAELERISGGAPGYPSVLAPCAGDPDWAVRIGDEDVSVLCDQALALNMLQLVLAGAEPGHPLDAPDGSVWAFLLLAARHLQWDLGRFSGSPRPPPRDTGMVQRARAAQQLLRAAGAIDDRPVRFIKADR